MALYYIGDVAYDSSYLAHHGIKGQKWGVRRFQNPDGTLTEAGKVRYYGEMRSEDEKWASVKKNTRRGYERALNRYEQVYGEEYANQRIAQKQAQKNMNKMLDRAKKIGYDISQDPNNSGDEKLKKYSDKFIDQLAVGVAAGKRMKDIESKTYQVMAQALKDGYNVQVKQMPIQTNKRGRMSAQLTLGVIGQLGYSAAMAYFGDPGYFEGNKYMVRKPKSTVKFESQ